MFYMGVTADTRGSASGVSVFSASSGVGVSLMKADKKKKRMSASRALLKSRMRSVGTFGS